MESFLNSLTCFNNVFTILLPFLMPNFHHGHAVFFCLHAFGALPLPGTFRCCATFAFRRFRCPALAVSVLQIFSDPIKNSQEFFLLLQGDPLFQLTVELLDLLLHALIKLLRLIRQDDLL